MTGTFITDTRSNVGSVGLYGVIGLSDITYLPVTCSSCQAIKERGATVVDGDDAIDVTPQLEA
jgi:hypothetical protein